MALKRTDDDGDDDDDDETSQLAGGRQVGNFIYTEGSPETEHGTTEDN